MKALFFAFFLSSSLAFAGNGGMVGGGRVPPSVLLEIPDLNISMRGTLDNRAGLNILKMKAADWSALEAAASGKLNVDLKILEKDGKEEEDIHSLALRTLSKGVVTLSDGEDVSALLVPESGE